MLAKEPSFPTFGCWQRGSVFRSACWLICFWHWTLDCGLRFKHERCPQTTFLHALGVITSSKALFIVPHCRLPESVDADTLCGANRFDPPPSMIYLSPPSAVQSDIQRTRSEHVTNSCSYWHAIEHQSQVNTKSSKTRGKSIALQAQVKTKSSKIRLSQSQVKSKSSKIRGKSSAVQAQVKTKSSQIGASHAQVKTKSSKTSDKSNSSQDQKFSKVGASQAQFKTKSSTTRSKSRALQAQINHKSSKPRQGKHTTSNIKAN